MKYELIAQISKDFKEVDFFISGGHFASCYPKEKSNSLTTNVYRKLKGQLKNFFKGGYYVKIEINQLPLNSENLRKLEQEAVDIAKAQLKLKT